MRLVTFAGVLALGLALATHGQSGNQGGSGSSSGGMGSMRHAAGFDDDDQNSQSGGEDPVMHARRVRMFNAERQKSVVSDTNKLVKLIADLNAEVSKQGSDSLTDEQLRKLAVIEKLAANVRKNMTNTSVELTPTIFPMNYPGLSH
jgi:hypothetical protein